MKVVDATGIGTTALVTVATATIHTGGTYPKYPKSGFFAMRLLRTERWKLLLSKLTGSGNLPSTCLRENSEWIGF